MSNAASLPTDHPTTFGSRYVSESRRALGRLLVVAATIALAAVALWQILYDTGATDLGFETWRPVLYAYLAWAVALGVGQVMMRARRWTHAARLHRRSGHLHDHKSHPRGA